MKRKFANSSVIRLAALLAIVTAMALGAVTALAHCEVPCGIYGDPARMDAMREDARTIDKAMAQVAALSKAKPVNYNQIVRWVTTKEKHAEKIQYIVWQYFLTQRVKPAKAGAKDKAYVAKLMLLHRISVYAMKCKQGIDRAWVKKLRQAIDAFAKAYFKHSHK